MRRHIAVAVLVACGVFASSASAAIDYGPAERLCLKQGGQQLHSITDSTTGLGQYTCIAGQGDASSYISLKELQRAQSLCVTRYDGLFVWDHGDSHFGSQGYFCENIPQ